MRIQDEIKTKRFSSDIERALINIIFTSSWISGIHNDYLRPYDLSIQQYNILRIVKGQHPKGVSITNIKSRMIERMSNVSRLVEKLRKNGLLERQPCEEDRRRVEVSLTPKGLALLEEVNATMPDFLANFENLTPEEAQVLSTLLDKLREEPDQASDSV